MKCPVTPKNNHVKGTLPNNEPQTNTNLMETVITVANDDIANGNVVQKKEIKPNQKSHRTNKENKQNGSKLVCQFCGYTGHTARDCRHKQKEASAHQSLPHEKQDRENNKHF